MKKLLFILIILCIFACKKKEEEIQPETKIENDTKEYCINLTYNGAAYKHTSTINANVLRKQNKLEIGSINETNGGCKLFINVDSVFNYTLFNLEYNSKTNIQTVSESKNYKSQSGKIEILKLDTINKIIEANFNAELYSYDSIKKTVSGNLYLQIELK